MCIERQDILVCLIFEDRELDFLEFGICMYITSLHLSNCMSYLVHKKWSQIFSYHSEIIGGSYDFHFKAIVNCADASKRDIISQLYFSRYAPFQRSSSMNAGVQGISWAAILPIWMAISFQNVLINSQSQQEYFLHAAIHLCTE